MYLQKFKSKRLLTVYYYNSMYVQVCIFRRARCEY